MPASGPRLGFIPAFKKPLVDKIIQAAENLVKEPYLYEQFYFTEEEWEKLKQKRIDWIDGRPPLGRVVKRAWAKGIQRRLTEIETGEKNWQRKSWILERFDPDSFGRFTKFPKPPKEPQKASDKELKAASKKVKKLENKKEEQLRDILGS